MPLHECTVHLNCRSLPHKIPDVTYRFRSPYRIRCAITIAVNTFGTKINRIYIEGKQCAYNVTCGTFAWPLLQWKKAICYVYLLAACYCQKYENIACWKMRVPRIYIASNKKTYLDLHAQCRNFCPILAKLIFSTYFYTVLFDTCGQTGWRTLRN